MACGARWDLDETSMGATVDLNRARTRILGLGRIIEVLESPYLQMSVIDFAHQVDRLYHSEK
ncbi:MAG: hypothetical protein JNM55_16840 [Anaerolineales bacterium]|nr:hypothetical protein [Anaerolineales bacterium]